MRAVDIDRQAIERRDFPIARRGYDTAAVDAHLQALAAEFEELQRSRRGAGAESSLAAAASSQVQSIIQAAESAAAEIESDAREAARAAREEADRDARRTREDAVEKARGHAAAVSQAATQLLARVGSMDGEVSRLIDGLRAGAGTLETDLQALQVEMAQLYDASAGRAAAPVRVDATASASVPLPPAPAPAQPVPAPSPEPSMSRAPQPDPDAPPPAPRAPEPPQQQAAPAAGDVAPAAGAQGAGDVDGARLIALNMALNGEAREETERYLAENFELDDRAGLVAEVYAAIEG
jgi:DivIVA domain-containing protein